jgi:dTDP-4-amino-4,6-dideoxygalactose transaminase
MEGLAINGGQPVVPKEYQRFEHPIISETVRARVIDQLDQAISLYSNDGVYKELEEKFSRWIGVENVLSVNSGTSALFTMLYSINAPLGSEIIVPCYTFFATATPLLLLGLQPVLADCDVNGNLSAIDVKAKLSPRTAAVVATHMWGVPGQISELSDVCKEAGVLFLEDASHAHGAKDALGRMIGSASDGCAWSLQGKKNLSAGEGGMFGTRHREMFERAVLVGHFNKRALVDVKSPNLRRYAVTGAGLNLRMHPIGAAIASTQLDIQEAMLKEKQEVADFFLKELSFDDAFEHPVLRGHERCSWYAYPLRIRFDDLGVNKEKFVKAIVAEGAVEVDIPGSTCPIDKYPAFADPQGLHQLDAALTGCVSGEYPGAEKFHRSLVKITVPYGPDRWKFAESYVGAIKKVWSHMDHLK